MHLGDRFNSLSLNWFFIFVSQWCDNSFPLQLFYFTFPLSPPSLVNFFLSLSILHNPTTSKEQTSSEFVGFHGRKKSLLRAQPEQMHNTHVYQVYLQGKNNTWYINQCMLILQIESRPLYFIGPPPSFSGFSQLKDQNKDIIICQHVFFFQQQDLVTPPLWMDSTWIWRFVLPRHGSLKKSSKNPTDEHKQRSFHRGIKTAEKTLDLGW